MAPLDEASDMYVLGVVGPSDSGKTALIERLVPRLGEFGRVATVKSIHHDVEVDEPGKDTHRHRQAGAEATVGVTPTRTFGFLERGKSGVDEAGGDESASLAPILDAFADHGIEYALVEGFAESSIPKVSVGPQEERALAEPVVAHVESGTSANLDEVIEAIEGLRRYETATSVVHREGRSRAERTIVVATLAAVGLASTAAWTHDRVDGALAGILEAVRAKSEVERASLHLRPPVGPGGTARAHLSVTSADREQAFDAATGALDRFVADSGIDASVEYLIRER